MNRRDLLAVGAGAALGARRLLPPWASRPTPTRAQYRWHREELALFVHFGINTFTDREWGDGGESPALFHPPALDARQWARAARAAGARAMILTAKHHDGFCLWPTATTTHSVSSSPWRGGQGDVVSEFVAACRDEGLGAGLYLSPWDRHEPSYGDSPRYNELYIAQLTELLTRYGRLVEVWFDGANGEGPNGKRQRYDWPRVFGTVRRLQPDAVIFSDAGPDVRWIGNEDGVAGETCWATIDPSAVPWPGYDAPGVRELLQRGDPAGSAWRPGETDVSIRPGWFYHADQDAKVRDAANLLELYFTSVGRNSKLLLNVPPAPDGRFHAMDVRRLAEFGELRSRLFAWDGAAGARMQRADNGRRITITPGAPFAFDVVRLEEDIRHGHVVSSYRVEAELDGAWRTVSRGTTIGHRKLDRIAPVTTSSVRLIVEDALDRPNVSRLSLHRR
ncbi:MAG TPA: alpha-L-fucosidase [Gemmatimonadales bacterium]|nr:alpha-L-fucosidase [Gemmatimonadales bacterium]